MIYLKLFLTFLQIGAFSFGGGYGMISLIREKVLMHGWLTEEEMLNMIAVAESTPGPIAVNMATFVGSSQGGFLGAILATLGVVLPSFAIIYIISVFLDNFLELTLIANAFKGIKVAVGFLILDAAFNIIKKMQKNVFSLSFMIASFGMMLLVNIFSWNFSSISLMLVVALISLMIQVFSKLRKAGGEKK